MISSKLLTTIKTLDKKNLEDLDLFLQSAFFNHHAQSANIIQLFQCIKKRVLEKESTDLEAFLKKESIYSMIYGEVPFVKGKIEKLMSLLFNLIKKFIIWSYSDIQNNESLQLLTLSRFYREKKLFNQFQLNIKKLENIQKKAPFQDEYFINTQYQIEKEKFEYQNIYNDRSSDVNLKNTLKSFELSCLASRLRLLYQLHYQKVHANILLDNVETTPTDIDKLLNQNPSWNIPIIVAYQEAFRLLFDYPNDNIKALEGLKSTLNNHKDDLSEQVTYTLQTLIRSYAIKQYNEGKPSYLKIAFKIFQEHLQLGYLYYQGKIHAVTFTNMVMFGLKLKQYDWVENFIQNYQHILIGTTVPEATVSFNLALLHFSRKEYDQAIDFLNFENEDIHLKIATKRLEIKIYFEQDSPLLEARLEAFKIYIFRISKKYLTAKSKSGNNNFVDILRQILHPKTFNNPARIQKIRAKIQELKILADREWLLEILENE